MTAELVYKLSGLSTQARKCNRLYSTLASDSFMMNSCEGLRIGTKALNMLVPVGSEKYMGMRVDS